MRDDIWLTNRSITSNINAEAESKESTKDLLKKEGYQQMDFHKKVLNFTKDFTNTRK